ncbi:MULTISPECIES: flagellar basal body P-ring formation chaperone FlgA [Rhodobacterales]|jgi:flagella basal body P-ring formation protein FlgA|uniref:Flagella basal body P-ring formation protein FlgA n=1 Tax=Phaeobacter gallaeciensis TaxID=60890 RepID=A0A1B0ZSZ8_9RHOB|nr:MULTISPECIES: flagellar basal body P-ring formation chaperone FlgA [Phaeobacter]MDF1772675.1 flagellar basal body P-ring formation chaperone FlgA [Pseudophaeobacter sp. bin_em_oilr2.035]ANP37292.1 flagellar basal body P-ring biosynthesis protein FlgA [Phaeobacter gallaeciensis]MDE4063264.1 flagellar basal body P-ring formation chaperone FlgA [Phaeobacter gallaeciensis]MDE4126286.1 flagellar basal body P-ring formation chaperone FlgA [Phaeobacter gallaeciensis]MDE4130760.1 flagellar basal bo
MKLKLALLVTLIAQTAWADILVPVRTVRPKEILTASDLALKPGEVLGALSDPEEVIGQEARVALYPGRPLRPGDVGPPAIVERNDMVILTFVQGGLSISAEGRALGRGAEGELIRVMNLASRTTVTGRIAADGSVEVRK